MGWNIQLPPAEFYSPKTPSYEIEKLVREITTVKKVAIDTETDGLTLWKCRPYYWSLSWESENGRDRRLTMPISTARFFSDTFADLEKFWIFANAKFDVHMFANLGIDIRGKLVDVSVMHALLYDEMPHGLKEIARQILGWKWTDFTDTFGSLRSGSCLCGAEKKSHLLGTGPCARTGCVAFHQVTALDRLYDAEASDPDLLVDYAANDAYGTWKSYQKLDAELREAVSWSPYPSTGDDPWPYPYHHIDTLADYYYKVELPFTRVLYVCERNGMKVDKAHLQEIAPGIKSEIDDLKLKIVEEAGYMLNPNSTPQLKDYFFGKLGMKPTRFTKGGKSGIKQPTVDAKFLESVEDDVPLAALVLEVRKLEKQYGTYIVDMPGRLDPNDRVHARLNQDVARTGRLSSSDPNMQNITKGDKDKFKLRNAFISDAGTDLIVADYQALEMRLLAAASMEPKMCQIFFEDKDIHMGNAELVFGFPYNDLKKAKKIDKEVKEGKLPESELTQYVLDCLNARDAVKTIGFGLNYGMKEKAMARRMGVHIDIAIEKIKKYMDTYPAVQEFFKTAVADVRETGGFAFTYLGRRRYLPDIGATNNKMDRFRAERQASNLPIQGTAADVCKMAMILLYDDQLDKKYDCFMQLQVHDEIIFQCPEEATPIVKPIIKEWMEHPFARDLAVPLIAEIGHGKAWGLAK